MTNEEILQIALKQSAYDCNCDFQDLMLVFLNKTPLTAVFTSAVRGVIICFLLNLHTVRAKILIRNSVYANI